MLCVVTLYLGPIVHAALWKTHFGWRRAVGQQQQHWLITARNLIVAPIAEEWVFRCCIYPLYAAAGLSTGASVAATALTFSAAHVHHVIGLVRSGCTWMHALGSVAGQFGYTGLLGAMAAYVLHVAHAAPGLVGMHAFCNWMGLPDLSWAAVGPGHPLHRWRPQVAAAFLAGIAGFGLCLWRLPALVAGHDAACAVR